MKPEADPARCVDCGDPVHNRDAAVVTPEGVFHKSCDVPPPPEPGW